MADRLAIVARGRLVTQGPVGEVLSSAGARGIVVRVGDPAGARAILTEAGIAADVDGDVLRVHVDAADGARVNRALAERGVYAAELRAGRGGPRDGLPGTDARRGARRVIGLLALRALPRAIAPGRDDARDRRGRRRRPSASRSRSSRRSRRPRRRSTRGSAELRTRARPVPRRALRPAQEAATRRSRRCARSSSSWRTTGRATPRFSEVEEILMGTAFIVILIGAVVGATLGGADWSAGSMATLLVWEPRRLRVLAARARRRRGHGARGHDARAGGLRGGAHAVPRRARHVRGDTGRVPGRPRHDRAPDLGRRRDVRADGVVARHDRPVHRRRPRRLARLPDHRRRVPVEPALLGPEDHVRPIGRGRRDRRDARAGRRRRCVPPSIFELTPGPRVGHAGGLGGRAAGASPPRASASAT